MDEVLGELWQVILHSKETEAEDVETLERAVRKIKPYAIKNGLPNFCVDTLIDILNLDPVNAEGSDLAVELIETLVPNDGFSDAHLEGLFMWFFTYNQINVPACKYFVLWFQTAITYDIIKKDFVQKKFYFSLLLHVSDPNYVRGLCWVLKELTTRAHAGPLAESLLITAYNEAKAAEKRHLAVLMEEFSEYSTKIKNMKVVKPSSGAPPKLDKSLKQLSNSWKQHCAGPDGEVDASAKISLLSKVRLWWEGERSQVSLLSVTTAEGRRMITLGGEAAHSVVEEQAEAALSAWLNGQTTSSHDVASLLKGLARLQAQQLQGLVCVRKFVEDMLVSWDGDDFRQEVFDLLPWLHFDTIDEVKRVMEGLVSVLVVSDVAFSAALLLSLKDLHVNMLSVHWVRKQKKQRVPFIGRPPLWTSDLLNSLERFCSLVKTVIKTMVVVHSASPAILAPALTYYHAVSCAEESVASREVAVWTVATPCVVLAAQMSSCIPVLDQLAALLLRYERVSVVRLERDGLKEEMAGLTVLVKDYLRDTQYLLSPAQREEGRAGSLMVSQLVGDAECEAALEEVAHLTSHRALAPVLQHIARQLDRPLHTLTPQELFLILEDFAPNLVNLLKEPAPVEPTEPTQ